MLAHTTRSILGGNHREVNKRQQTSSPGELNQFAAVASGASKLGIESTVEPEEVLMIEETWMHPYLAYMMNKTLPKDTIESRRII
jgi:hypothetical protein